MGKLDEGLHGDLILMRSVLAREVRDRFAAGLREIAPQFRRAKGELPAGARLYSWEPRPGLTFYVLLQVHHMEDWFTLEVAVSDSGKWPSSALLAVPVGLGGGSCRFRLCRLWEPQLDPWWELAPRPGAGAAFEAYLERPPVDELRGRVGPAVNDALAALRDFGLPYFERLAGLS